MSTLFIKDRNGNSLQTVTEFRGGPREIAERLSGYKDGTYKIFNHMGATEGMSTSPRWSTTRLTTPLLFLSAR